MKTDSVILGFLGSGTIEMYARPDTIGHLLKWTFGDVTSSQVGATSTYDHEFTMGTSIKSFTVHDVTEEDSDARLCIGTVIKSLTFEAPRGGVVTVRAEVQYVDEIIETAQSYSAVSTLRPFVFHDGSITWGGSELADVESFRITISNDIPDDTHEIGSAKLQSIELQGFSITGEMDLKFKDWSIRKQFYGAQESGSEPDNPQTEDRTFALSIVLSSELTGDDSYKYSLTFSFPKCTIKENPMTRRTRERLTQRMVFEALKDSNNKVTLRNKTTSY